MTSLFREKTRMSIILLSIVLEGVVSAIQQKLEVKSVKFAKEK